MSEPESVAQQTRSRSGRAFDHPVFRGTDPERLARILSAAPPRAVEAGAVVSLPDGPPRLHLVISGLLRCYRLTSSGRQLLLELIPAGGFDGLIRMSGRPGHYTVAVEDSIVVSMTRPVLDEAIAADPRMSANLVWAAAARLSIREQQMEAIAARGGVVGVAGLLLSLAERSGLPRDHRTALPGGLTHQTMAEMLGVRRETVTGAIRHLKAAGAVEKADGAYIVDTAALQDLTGV